MGNWALNTRPVMSFLSRSTKVSVNDIDDVILTSITSDVCVTNRQPNNYKKAMLSQGNRAMTL